MDKIVIEGIDAYEGEWKIDAGYFTNRELHTIKRLSGVPAGKLEDAFADGDSDIIIALAVIALERAGKYVDEDLLWDAEAGKIQLVGEPVKDDALPPPRSNADESSSSDGNGSSSGGSGESASVTNLNPPSATTEVSSPVSVTSSQARSAS